MKIAQIAPLYESVPPKFYGGTERVVAHLTNELIRKGHEVTLFASGDSETLAGLVACREVALRLDQNPLSWDLPAHFAMLEEVRRRATEFDILHFHLDCFHFPLFKDLTKRTLTTVHGRQDITDLVPVYRAYPDFPLVSISDSQRRPQPHLRWVRTVHHGYPITQYLPPKKPAGDYLAFLGRVAPEKGVDQAIFIADRAGYPLRIAAKIDPADLDYFNKRIAPLLNRAVHARYIGEIAEHQKSDFLGNAVALLFPIDWPEPFGLVLIEAMACGTPVIAYDRGSVREIIDDGITGFIVETCEEAAAAIREAVTLDRSRIRKTFEQRFSVANMASGYELAYQTVLLESARTHWPQAVLSSHELHEPGGGFDRGAAA